MSGEYFVLQGAKSIALPTKLGQTMKVSEASGSELVWKSYRRNGDLWFEAKYDLLGIDLIKTTDEEIATRLRKIIRAAIRNNSEFLSKWKKYKVETFLEFEPEWGLGSSSTLIHTIAQWAEVSPFHVFFALEDGSGYDIACANADGPIYYQLKDDQISFGPSDFNPKFKKQLYFIYSGQKQNSRESVKAFNKKAPASAKLIDEISALSEEMESAKTLSSFEKLMDQHEEVLSKNLDFEKIKSERFSDYWGSIKSLGAWGGDFILATSEEDPKKTSQYFKNKGLDICYTFDDLIL